MKMRKFLQKSALKNGNHIKAKVIQAIYTLLDYMVN